MGQGGERRRDGDDFVGDARRAPGPHRPGRARGTIKPAAVRLIERHGDALLATARRYTVSREDAEDAYQRGLEILLARAPALPEDELLPWMKTVVKHEAFAIWRSRERTVASPAEAEPLDRAASPTPEPDEQVERYERLALGAEAIAQLKPQEVRCLLLRAEGHSYRQICEITGWTYTKVNRCLTEGRRSFLRRVAGIESGAECDRLSPLLSALADGEATAADMAALRPHLRSCLACRAALRTFRELPHRAAEVIPVGAAAGSEDGPATLWRWFESSVSWVQERTATAGMKLQAAVEGSSAGKVAAVAASTVALAGGAVAVRSLEEDAGPRAPAIAQREGLLERVAPANLLPELPDEVPVEVAAVEPVPLPVTPPPAPVPPPIPPPPPAPLLPPAPPQAPPPVTDTPEQAVRANEVPDRITVPITDPGESAIDGTNDEDRSIDPFLPPADPPDEEASAPSRSPDQPAP